ncbi:hypothetical protein [Nocardia sp. NPDC052316]|uniref:hypothetical protein n=1 Tax=Nocardia sp. NPDC052316 TaxID=3364329 RepID=UPI0037CA8A94
MHLLAYMLGDRGALCGGDYLFHAAVGLVDVPLDKSALFEPIDEHGSAGWQKQADVAGIDQLLDRLERDEFDLVAVGRALLANPDRATKALQGRLDETIAFDRAVEVPQLIQPSPASLAGPQGSSA